MARKDNRNYEEEYILMDDEVYERPKAVYHDEIIALVAIASAILLIMSNFNMSGRVGAFVNSVLFGIFGLPAYIAPIVLVFVVLIYLANKNNMFAIRKCVSASVLLIVVCALIQMTNFDDTYKITTYYTLSASEKTGGGLIGGCVCAVLNSWFGFGGTLVILILMAVISGIIISEKTFIKAVSRALDSASYKFKFKNRDEVWEEDLSDEIEESYDEEVCDSEMEIEDSDNNENEEDPIPTTESPKPRKRVAKTFNIFKSFTEAKQEEEAAQSDDIEVGYLDEEDYDDSEDSSLEEDMQEDYYEEDSSDIEDEYSQEVASQFRMRTTAEYDIRNLADSLINGTLEQSEEFDADNISFEQLTTDDVFDARSGKMREVSPVQTEAQSGIVKKDSLISPYETVVTHGQSHIGAGGAVVSGDRVEQAPVMSTVVVKEQRRPKMRYRRPNIELLVKSPFTDKKKAEKEQAETKERLQSTFDSFGVGAKITNVSAGPAVTRYEVQPNQGVKVSKITNLADDIKLNLAAADIRIEAPIPGKAAVGIEVPNKGETTTVMIRELIESQQFKKQKSSLSFAVGKDISGQVVIADIAKMPHLLIAGQTGAGKSVCINTLIMSLLYKASPDDVKLIMIDPKVVELSVYNGIPHLLVPVVTDPRKASGALNWALQEMTERYQKFAEAGVRDITSFNEKVTSIPNNNIPRYQKLPQIVIIIDELADLMMVAPGEVEDAICRLAQMARAAGLHLIIATQRPSVNVITGLIKANVPSRIAFSVASQIDSRTIIDGSGAEKLLGKGDMLFYPSGYPKPVRVQGAFISDKEVSDVVDYLKQFNAGGYDTDIDNKITTASVEKVEAAAVEKKAPDKDEYFIEAGRFVIEKEKASIGMLQRVYKIGFNRAARIMDQLCEAGVVSGEDGTKPRNILMTHDEFNKYIEECL